MKKFKKILLALIVTILMVGVFSAGIFVRADETPITVDLKDVYIRGKKVGSATYRNGYLYKPLLNGNTRVFKVIDGNGVNDVSQSDVYYCIKAGVGFGAGESTSESDSTSSTTYTEQGEFTDLNVLKIYNDNLKATDTYLRGLASGNENRTHWERLTSTQADNLKWIEDPQSPQEIIPKDKYYKLIYLLDHLYINFKSESISFDELKKLEIETTDLFDWNERNNLTNINIPIKTVNTTGEITINGHSYPAILTKDDIDVIQQLAIWHFTNQGDTVSPGQYDYYYNSASHINSMELINSNLGYPSTNPKQLIDDGMDELPVDRDGRTDEEWEKAWYEYQINYFKIVYMQSLYSKLIEDAEQNGNAEYYNNRSKENTKSGKLNYDGPMSTDGVIAENKDGFYIVGKFSLPGKYSGIYEPSINFKSNNTNINDKIKIYVGNNKNVISTQTPKSPENITASDLENGNLYIAISRADANALKINKVEIEVTFKKTNRQLKYYSAGESAQPLVKIEETPVDYSFTGEFIIPKIHDLALRKFITKIGTQNITDREPQIPGTEVANLLNGSNTKFDNGKTVEKDHTKAKKEVKPGQLVEYTIRIYNEGDVDGTATEVVDYLPSGLLLAPDNKTNVDYGWTEDPIDAKAAAAGYRAIKTTHLSTLNNIQAFNGTEVKYVDLKVVCEVTADYGDTEKNLKNVAEITKERYDDKEDSVVLNPDSTPDNLDGNKVKEYNPGTSEDGKGYEDDDDFEHLYLPAKHFDLSLRKYITMKNTTDITNRNPNVDTGKLNETDAEGKPITTSTYKHRKDPVAVKSGDKVQYTITVYNEGSIDGRATEVTDQLPDGVKFIRAVSGNFEWSNQSTYDEKTNNKVILSRKSSNTDNLKAYDGEKKLDSEDIVLECEVTADSDTNNSQILTNIAWISKATNVNNINDRDSQPTTSPNVAQKDLEKYKGNKSNDDSNPSNPENYYKGEQDDDDFERLVILPEKFDLKLIKRITKVNDENVPERIKSIDVSQLNIADSNGNIPATNTTAKYNLDKTPVSVTKGDIVTYTFRVYNEGMKDGYAAKLTEDVPEGLLALVTTKSDEEIDADTTLTQAEKDAYKFNKKYLWKANASNSNLITTDYLSKEQETIRIAALDANATEADRKNATALIRNFGPNDGSKKEEDLDYKEISIKMKVISDNITGKTIQNEAEISKYQDKNGNEIEDRDSRSDVWTRKDDNIKDKEDDEDYDIIKLKQFDLALRKNIVTVTRKDGDKAKTITISTRTPNIEKGTIATEGTATYKHRKDAVEVKKGDIVTYNLTIYNEGEIDGRATKVVDQLPDGLKFISVLSENYKLEKYDTDKNIVTLAKIENNNLKAYDGKDLKSEIITIECEVTAKPNSKNSKILTNIAWISEDANEPGIADKDSQPTTSPNVEQKDLEKYKGNKSNDDSNPSNPQNYYKGEQDDDDFERLVLLPEIFDLSLRKFITAVNETEVTTRIPKVDTSKLKDGSATTATYTHPKDPILVTTKSIVTYTIRVYNEGNLDGYASEIKDDMPEGLEFLPENETNKEYRWKMIDKDGKETKDIKEAVSIITDYLSKEQEEERKSKAAEGSKDDTSSLLKAYDKENDKIYYKDVKVAFKVIEPSTSERILINQAQISKDEDEEGNDITDRDSTPDKWIEEDDDQDIEKVRVQYFDLSLRKFITAVNDTEITTRIPKVDTSKLKDGSATTATYTHPKDPILVTNSSVVTYTIRVYNEGNIDGYASEVKDDIPEGLEYLPENETNKEYRWKMIDKDGKETKDIKEAVSIITDYLSKEQEKEREDKKSSSSEGKKVDTSSLIKAYDKENDKIYYKDVKVAFKVIEPNTSDRIIINQAQISKDEDENGNDVEDRDSTPDKWIEEDDDQDIEKLKVQYFDLSLRKWVTEAIVNDNGTVTTTKTGHKAEDDPESIVKVEIKDKKLNSIVVKFKYSIRVTNEGTIAGYAKEIKDYIPSGLKFVAEDNKKWKQLDEKTIVTDQAKDILLEPGQSTEVEVILTWINGNDNLALQVNYAEISEDYNEFGAPDIDSTPNNKKEGEDDIDEAPVLLSIRTGQMRIYFGIIGSVLVIIIAGVAFIKKFVI